MANAVGIIEINNYEVKISQNFFYESLFWDELYRGLSHFVGRIRHKTWFEQLSMMFKCSGHFSSVWCEQNVALQEKIFEFETPVLQIFGTVAIKNDLWNLSQIFNSDRLSGYRGLYPLTSLLSHSCQPNCRPVISKTGRCGSRCIATVDIEAGEELTINYVHLHLSTL